MNLAFPQSPRNISSNRIGERCCSSLRLAAEREIFRLPDRVKASLFVEYRERSGESAVLFCVLCGKVDALNNSKGEAERLKSVD